MLPSPIPVVLLTFVPPPGSVFIVDIWSLVIQPLTSACVGRAAPVCATPVIRKKRGMLAKSMNACFVELTRCTNPCILLLHFVFFAKLITQLLQQFSRTARQIIIVCQCGGKKQDNQSRRHSRWTPVVGNYTQAKLPF